MTDLPPLNFTAQTLAAPDAAKAALHQKLLASFRCEAGRVMTGLLTCPEEGHREWRAEAEQLLQRFVQESAWIEHQTAIAFAPSAQS